MAMSQKECLEKTGQAFGVLEADGNFTWHPDWMSAELSRYAPVPKTPEQIATKRAAMLEMAAKGRAAQAAKKAEIKRKQSEIHEPCGYTLALCVCNMGVKGKITKKQAIFDEIDQRNANVVSDHEAGVVTGS